MTIEMVSVEQLKPYREFDRSVLSKFTFVNLLKWFVTFGPKFKLYRHYFIKYYLLKCSIKKRGVYTPIWIFIHSETGKIHISEGNTRLAVCEELGIKNIPARVFCFNREDKFKKHKLPPRQIHDKRKMGFMTNPSTLGFKKAQ